MAKTSPVQCSRSNVTPCSVASRTRRCHVSAIVSGRRFVAGDMVRASSRAFALAVSERFPNLLLVTLYRCDRTYKYGIAN